MWISKEAEIRKKELLDAALELFYESGYDSTSINDIIKRVGVTKGAFYYHFKSKDEVLDTIALQQAQEMLEVFIKTADGNDKNALDKINRIISGMQQYRAETRGKRLKIFEVMDRSENLKLKQRVFENYMRLSKPVVSKIIEQGVEEGIFKTAFTDELAEYYIHFSITINGIFNKLLSSVDENNKLLSSVDENNKLLSSVDENKKLISSMDEKPENIEIIKRKAAFYEEIFAKILGVKEGSIKLVEPVLKSCNSYQDLK